jgi:acetyl esterase/lipase
MRIYALIFITLLTCASAFGQPGSRAERFDQIDRNGDGKVTPDELPRPRLFQRLDRNGDGVIQRDEILRDDQGDLQSPEEPSHTPHLNLRYAAIDGIDPDLLSLDLYVPKPLESQKAPVLIMIHGGGWRRGDKANPPIVGAKRQHFLANGYIFASINYRLSPESLSGEGIRHPVHAQDCASAIAWIHDHIAEYGGDPDQLHLMGHSAGGHLAAIVGTNERFLATHEKDLSILKTNVLLDPAALDILGYLNAADGRGMTLLYKRIFGTDEANQRDASPKEHVAPGKSIPPTLIFYAGDRMQHDQFAPAFAKALTEAGSPSQAIDTVSLDHAQINSRIGMIDDSMTQLIMRLHAGEDATTFPTSFEPAGQSSRIPLRPAFERSYFAGLRDCDRSVAGQLRKPCASST